MSEFEGKAENICSRVFRLLTTHSGHSGPMHWTLSSFRPIIRSDLWGAAHGCRGLVTWPWARAVRGYVSRKRILKAIQNLGDADKTSEAVSPARPAPARDTGERRQLTVMFCDLVGSTAISARLDPEDLSSVLSAFQKACVSAVSAFGGSIAKYMGDGALVYFGYPEAHEDDAE